VPYVHADFSLSTSPNLFFPHPPRFVSALFDGSSDFLTRSAPVSAGNADLFAQPANSSHPPLHVRHNSFLFTLPSWIAFFLA